MIETNVDQNPVDYGLSLFLSLYLCLTLIRLPTPIHSLSLSLWFIYSFARPPIAGVMPLFMFDLFKKKEISVIEMNAHF